MRKMKSWFLKRGYRENRVDQETGKVEISESSGRTNKRDADVCLVATYHPLLENIRRIFHRHLDLLYTDPKVEEFKHLIPWLRFVVQEKLAAI